jgi:predicted hotdog family 3-hydroxylacyl-ACP dehydratase
MFSLQHNWRRGQNRFCPEAGCTREVAQTMYTHVSKCKNNKRRKEKIKMKLLFGMRELVTVTNIGTLSVSNFTCISEQCRQDGTQENSLFSCNC